MKKFKSEPEKELNKLLTELSLSPIYEPDKFQVIMVKETKYIPDFLVGDTYIECKSPHRHVKESLIKLAAFIKQYPDIKLILIGKDLDAPIPRWKRMNLRNFCKTHDIPCFDMDDLSITALTNLLS